MTRIALRKYRNNDLKCQEVLKDISVLAGQEQSTNSFINKSIEKIGVELLLDKIIVCKYGYDNELLSEICSWTKQYLVHDIFHYTVEINEIKWLNNEFNRLGYLDLYKTDEVDNEQLRTLLENHDFKSILAVPFYLDSKYNGFIGFGQSDYYRRWNLTEINMIYSLSIVISHAMMRQKIQDRLIKEKEQLKMTLLSANDGIIVTDKRGNITMVNSVAEEIIELKQEYIIGRTANEIITILDKDDEQPMENYIDKVLRTRELVNWGNSHILITESNNVKYIDSYAVPIINYNGKVIGAIMALWNITDHIKKQEELVYVSSHDVLTGLYNRAYYEQEIAQIDTKYKSPLSIIMGDVNGLKMTNDVFGHQVGDDLLKIIGDIIKSCCRQEDIVARIGGDEFIIILPESSNDLANEICQNIRLRCDSVISQRHIEINKDIPKISISLGYATKQDESNHIRDIIKQAEDMMYKNKLLEGKSLRSTIILTMQNLLSQKSHENSEHIKRLEILCELMGRELELSIDRIEELQLLAKLHDIGKIAIKEEILMKKEELTDDEWQEIIRHPESGYRILKAVPELSHIAQYVLCHHERWDGEGYPHGLEGDEIPLLSRILFVVDTFDAMISIRPYRDNMAIDIAIQELQKEAGTKLDPFLVKIFIDKVLNDYLNIIEN